MVEPLVDIDVEDFKSFINNVETLLSFIDNPAIGFHEFQKVRLSVKSDCRFFSDLVIKAEAK